MVRVKEQCYCCLSCYSHCEALNDSIQYIVCNPCLITLLPVQSNVYQGHSREAENVPVISNLKYIHFSFMGKMRPSGQ